MPHKTGQPEAEHNYEFRPVTAKDVAMIAEWLEKPHVRQWQGDPATELANIREHMDSISVEPLIILMDGKPVGYMQNYDPHMEDDHPYRDQPTGTLGIDLFIGEPELTGKGHGPRIIDAIVEELFDEGAPRIIIDPDPTNERAIRAYRKAGFRDIGFRTSVYGPALLMARDAPNEMVLK